MERKFRNHFEHFDERIEKFAIRREGNFVDANVGPISAISGLDSSAFFRWFDPATSQLTFRGETLDLEALVEAVSDVGSRAREEFSR